MNKPVATVTMSNNAYWLGVFLIYLFMVGGSYLGGVVVTVATAGSEKPASNALDFRVESAAPLHVEYFPTDPIDRLTPLDFASYVFRGSSTVMQVQMSETPACLPEESQPFKLFGRCWYPVETVDIYPELFEDGAVVRIHTPQRPQIILAENGDWLVMP